MSKQKESKEIGSYIIGILFSIMGMFTISEKPHILGISFLICGLLLIPIIRKMIEKLSDTKFPTYIKVILGLIPIIIFIVWGVGSDMQEASKIDAWLDSTYNEQLKIDFKITKDFSKEDFQYFLIEVFDEDKHVYYKKFDYDEFKKLIDEDYSFGDHYEVIVPFREINKSNSWDNKYLLTLVLKETSINSETKYISGLPKYTESDSFEDNKIELNINKKMENYISVTLKNIGLMKIKNKNYIRIDIKVENIGEEKISYYSPNPAILGMNGEQIDKSYISSYDFKDIFESGDIYPGVTKTGSLFFEVENLENLKLKELIIETGLSSYSKESRNIGDGQALFYDKEYVFSYNLTSFSLN